MKQREDYGGKVEEEVEVKQRDEDSGIVEDQVQMKQREGYGEIVEEKVEVNQRDEDSGIVEDKVQMKQREDYGEIVKEEVEVKQKDEDSGIVEDQVQMKQREDYGEIVEEEVEVKQREEDSRILEEKIEEAAFEMSSTDYEPDQNEPLNIVVELDNESVPEDDLCADVFTTEEPPKNQHTLATVAKDNTIIAEEKQKTVELKKPKETIKEGGQSSDKNKAPVIVSDVGKVEPSANPMKMNEGVARASAKGKPRLAQ